MSLAALLSPCTLQLKKSHIVGFDTCRFTMRIAVVGGDHLIRVKLTPVTMVRNLSQLRPDAVRIVEVGPRDGLQNIKTTIPTSTKLELISRLRQTGLKTIEITSVVSPKAIPQLADCRQVLADGAIKGMIGDDSLRSSCADSELEGPGDRPG